MREMLPNVRMQPKGRFLGIRLLVASPQELLLRISNCEIQWNCVQHCAYVLSAGFRVYPDFLGEG